MEGIDEVVLAQIKQVEEQDEGQVLAEMAGETVKDFVYEFKRKDRQGKEVRVVKLSWVGVREVARAKGNIILSDPQVSETPDYFRIIIKGTDIKRNFSIFGGCHQPKMMKVKEYDQQGREAGFRMEEDPFAFTKCLSKAQRNTLEPCIPGGFVVRMIDKFLQAAGKPPLYLTEGKAVIAQGSRPIMKNYSEWQKVTEEQVKDWNELEKIFWNLTHKQPREMYKELGFSSLKERLESKSTPWDHFCALRQVYCLHGGQKEGY